MTVSARYVVSATIIFAVVSVLPIFLVDGAEALAAFGSYLGGIATAIAIFWIVYNAHMQRMSIDYQQSELNLMRSANETSAQANSLDAFLRFLDHSSNSISEDARQIVDLYRNSNPNLENDLKGLYDQYISGDTNCYFRFISSNDECYQWIRSAIKEKSPFSLVSVCHDVIRKYDIVSSKMSSLNYDKEIYEVLISSSPLAQTNRLLRIAIQDSTDQASS